MSRNNENISPPSAQAKPPLLPPPPYTEFPATTMGPSTSLSTHIPSSLSPSDPSASFPAPMLMPSSNPHPGYGPTPLAANQPLLPYVYYAPRGSADSRAKWRFFVAWFWAIVLWTLCVFVIGLGLWDEDGWVWDKLGWVGSFGWSVGYWLKLKMLDGAGAVA